MRGYIYTPIHTIAIDNIDSVELSETESMVKISAKGTTYYFRSEKCNNMSIKEIYEDIQHQLYLSGVNNG